MQTIKIILKETLNGGSTVITVYVVITFSTLYGILEDLDIQTGICYMEEGTTISVIQFICLWKHLEPFESLCTSTPCCHHLFF
jgi:hypothetical protein